MGLDLSPDSIGQWKSHLRIQVNSMSMISGGALWIMEFQYRRKKRNKFIRNSTETEMG
jgi:hypothetical protein